MPFTLDPSPVLVAMFRQSSLVDFASRVLLASAMRPPGGRSLARLLAGSVLSVLAASGRRASAAVSVSAAASAALRIARGLLGGRRLGRGLDLSRSLVLGRGAGRLIGRRRFPPRRRRLVGRGRVCVSGRGSLGSGGSPAGSRRTSFFSRPGRARSRALPTSALSVSDEHLKVDATTPPDLAVSASRTAAPRGAQLLYFDGLPSIRAPLNGGSSSARLVGESLRLWRRRPRTNSRGRCRRRSSLTSQERPGRRLRRFSASS